MMNRAARIADKAGSGHVWCSKAAWDALDASMPPGQAPVQMQPLGAFGLKGVAEPVDLVHAVLKQPVP